MAHCWPLASLVSRRHVFSVGTCPPSARVLRFPASLRCLCFFGTHTDYRLRPFCSSFTLLFFPTLLLSLGSPSTLFTLPSPSALSALRPLLGVASSLCQSGADTPPSLVTVTGGFLHPANVLRFFPFAPNHRKTFFLFFLFGVEFWRETLAE